MADLGYGPESMVGPDESLLTRMAGGLGQLVPCESGRDGGWMRGGTRPGTASKLMSAADFILWVLEDF